MTDDDGLDPFDHPLRHLRRVAPPWAIEGKTVCGRELDDVKSWVTFEEAKTLGNKYGRARLQFLFCQTCLGRYRDKADYPGRWDQPGEPGRIVADWSGRGWSVDPDVEADLRALADLVALHRDEFDAIRAIRARGDDLSTRRQQRGRR